MLNEIDLSRVNLNLLTVFEAVMHERNIGRAADRLVLTPSAISHSVKRLRELLGDPLFLRNPKGVTPTERALKLAEPIAAILSDVRAMLATTEKFDPAVSTRRFTIGAPDAVAAVVLPSLLTILRMEAPNLSIAVHQVLPSPSDRATGQPWRNALVDLDNRRLDIALLPTQDIPARFHSWLAYEDDFTIACSSRHPGCGPLDLAAYCAQSHVLVSQTGEPEGFVDEVLSSLGYRRRVAVSVPTFLLALAIVADSDLMVAAPRSFVRSHGPRFGLVALEPPVELGKGGIWALSPKGAMADAGLAFLHDAMARAMRGRS